MFAPVSSAHGYPRWQTAPPTLPHVEAQKAARDRVHGRDALAAEPAERKVYRLRPPERGDGGASEALRAMLDQEQLAAVEGAAGRTLILASAGSGKTRTIVATLAHAIDRGTPPEAVMLVTFTRRAAKEMVQRAGALTGVDLQAVTAGTFHAVCRRILARYGPLVGLPSSFTVLDAEDQAEVCAMARDAVLAGRETRPSLPKPATIVG